MRESEEARVERISGLVGGRFKLTTIILKRMQEYHKMGRAFMPTVSSFDELFNYVLDEIERGKIGLALPTAATAESLQESEA